jgi:hypothetical protein
MVLVVASNLFSIDAKGQTKEETETWIKSKVTESNFAESIYFSDNFMFVLDCYGSNEDIYNVMKVDLSKVKRVQRRESRDGDGEILFVVEMYFGNEDILRATLCSGNSECYPNGKIILEKIKKDESVMANIDFSDCQRYSGHMFFTLSKYCHSEELKQRMLKALTHLAKLHDGCDPNKKNTEAF